MGIVRCPDLFEIIEFPDFRAEQVDDDVTGIDQNPIALRETLYRDSLHATQSAFGIPSTLAGRPVSFFTSCARWSARAATCRPERPDAMIMKSASEDLPSRSMKRMSSALSSSRALARASATLRISSSVACWAGWSRGALGVRGPVPSCYVVFR